MLEWSRTLLLPKVNAIGDPQAPALPAKSSARAPGNKPLDHRSTCHCHLLVGMPSTRGKRGIPSDEEPKEKRLITHHFRTMRGISAAAGKAPSKAQHKSTAGPKTPAAKDRPTSAKLKAAESAGKPKALEARASARLAKTTATKPDCKAAAAKAALPGTKSKRVPAQAASVAKKPKLPPQTVSCCCSCFRPQMLTHAVYHPKASLVCNANRSDNSSGHSSCWLLYANSMLVSYSTLGSGHGAAD